MPGGRYVRLVEDFNRDRTAARIAQINQRRKPNQRLGALANLQQLRQLAEAPAGVALGSFRSYYFNSCLRTFYGG